MQATITNFWVVAVAVVVYLCFLIVLGVIGRLRARSKSAREFYLAGRSLGVVALIFTIYATQYSANTQVGYAATGYRVGLLFIALPAFFVAVIAFTRLYAFKLRTYAVANGLITPGEYIVARFGSVWLGRMVGILMVIASINFILTNLVAAGLVVEVLSGGGVPFWVGVVVISAVILIYETLSGLRGVAWTDIIQGLLLLGGGIVFLVVVFVLAANSDISLRDLERSNPALFSQPDTGGNIEVLSALLLVGLGGSVYPQLIQRIYASRSNRALRLAFGAAVIIPFVTVLPALLWGLAGNLLVPGLNAVESERLTPFLLSHISEQSPLLIAVVSLVVIGLVGAIMSTVDSLLLSISSIVSHDIFNFTPREKRRFGKFPALKPLSFAKFGAVGKARLLSIVTIVLTVLLTLVIGNSGSIWGFIQIKFSLLLPCLPAFYLGVYHKKLTATPIWIGMLGGLGVTVLLYLLGARPFGVHEGLIGLAVNFALIALFLIMSRIYDKLKDVKRG